jgi:kumamolisin
MSRIATDRQERAVLQGNTHTPLGSERQSGKLHPETELQVTVVLRRSRELPELQSALGNKLPHQREHLTREQLALVHGARADDIARVGSFAREHGLTVHEIAAHRRAVTLVGNARAMELAFGVELVHLEHERGKYIGTSAPPSVPYDLRNTVQAVLGLHTRPTSLRPHIRHQNTTQPFWTVRELAAAYGFPANSSGQGQCIALVELGGGYHEEDLQQFFTGLGMPMPSVTCHSVDGTENSPVSADKIRQFLEVVEGKRHISSVSPEDLAAAQCTLEVTMDIELAGALAPGAEIVVYMAPNTEQGIYNAVSMAISEQNNLPCAISISWGEPEAGVSEAYLNCVDEILRDAAMLGVTVCASSGDAGAMDGSPDKKPAVNFPASSPHVLSCGGSTVKTANGQLIEESAWNCSQHGIHGATGGGVSQRFELPSWQEELAVPIGPTGKKGRGVPDVAGPACPHCGSAILVGGEVCSSAGTSAVAPMWAALVACANHAMGARCGYLTPLLYKLSKTDGKSPLREITIGDNGFYKAGPGWNPCTGLGSPIGDRLIDVLGRR